MRGSSGSWNLEGNDVFESVWRKALSLSALDMVLIFSAMATNVLFFQSYFDEELKGLQDYSASKALACDHRILADTLPAAKQIAVQLEWGATPPSSARKSYVQFSCF